MGGICERHDTLQSYEGTNCLVGVKRFCRKTKKNTIVKKIDISLSHSRLNGSTTTTRNAGRRLATC